MKFLIFLLTIKNFCFIIQSIKKFLIFEEVKCMQVYERVREYINERGIKQVVVAKKAGIPVATFSAIMCGRRTLYANDLEAICAALGVSAETFIYPARTA